MEYVNHVVKKAVRCPPELATFSGRWLTHTVYETKGAAPCIGWLRSIRLGFGYIILERVCQPCCRNTGMVPPRAYHFFETMVDAHCVRDEGDYTLYRLVAFHSVRVRVRVYYS